MANDTVTAPQGFSSAGVACGIKKSGALDLGLLVVESPSPAAAVFTTNRFCGAPVTVGREHMRAGTLRAIVVNSGVSNVAMGDRGVRDARAMCDQVASELDCEVTQVLPGSTGIIGHPLPMKKVRAGISAAFDSLSVSAKAGGQFARAILTTDTCVKQACERVRIGKRTVTVAGCAKGSGMIAPNMATMLSYITTDANLTPKELNRILRNAADMSFNRITVDECPSTSDTVAIMASGLAGAVPLNKKKAVAQAIEAVCLNLAEQVVTDGEGATRIFEVNVTGAKTGTEAHAAARAIASSPLVKTAVHGGDPNWGRIIQALGMSDARMQPEKVTVKIGGLPVFAKGRPKPAANSRKLVSIMRKPRINITIDLAIGKASDRVISCDFSREYITINADYHT